MRTAANITDDEILELSRESKVSFGTAWDALGDGPRHDREQMRARQVCADAMNRRARR